MHIVKNVVLIMGRIERNPKLWGCVYRNHGIELENLKPNYMEL